MEKGGAKLSINKAAARSIKHKQRDNNSLYNVLRSIYEDSVFVGEISQVWPQLPLLANLPCGLWYSPNFHSTCCFKSSDGRTNKCSFNTSRLNLHLAQLAGENGGCMIVDSTRRKKRCFPDSLSKTIPIWTCVLNRAIAHFRRDHITDAASQKNFDGSDNGRVEIARDVSCDWDCSLHLPPAMVSYKEVASIEDKLDEWTEQVNASGADIGSLAACLKKPLRPLWISRETVWLDKEPHHDSYDFTPIILVSASSLIHVSQCRTKSISMFSWHYIPGAGDREKSWAKGLSPTLFWDHVNDLIYSSPDVCNQKVIDIVKRSKVHRAYTGESAPQIKIKPLSLDSLSYKEPSPVSNTSNIEPSEGLAVSTSQFDSMTRVSKFAAYQRQLADKNETAQARKGLGTTPIEKTLATPAVVVALPRSQAIPEVVAQMDHGGKEKEHKHSKQTQLPHVPQGSNEVFPSGVNTDFWGEIDFHVNKAVDRVGEAVKRGRELEAEVVELRKLKQRVEDSIMNEQILKARNEELKHTNIDLKNKLQNTASLTMKLGEERKVNTLTEELNKAEKERLAALKQKDSFRQKMDFLLRDNKSTIVLLRQAEDSKRKLAFELAKVKKQFNEVEKLHKEAEEDCVAIGQEQFDNAINQILALNHGVAIQTDGATSIGLVEGCNIINAETKEVLLPLPPSASKIVSPVTCFSSTTPPS